MQNCQDPRGDNNNSSSNNHLFSKLNMFPNVNLLHLIHVTALKPAIAPEPVRTKTSCSHATTGYTSACTRGERREGGQEEGFGFFGQCARMPVHHHQQQQVEHKPWVGCCTKDPSNHNPRQLPSSTSRVRDVVSTTKAVPVAATIPRREGKKSLYNCDEISSCSSGSSRSSKSGRSSNNLTSSEAAAAAAAFRVRKRRSLFRNALLSATNVVEPDDDVVDDPLLRIREISFVKQGREEGVGANTNHLSIADEAAPGATVSGMKRNLGNSNLLSSDTLCDTPRGDGRNREDDMGCQPMTIKHRSKPNIEKDMDNNEIVDSSNNDASTNNTVIGVPHQIHLVQDDTEEENDGYGYYGDDCSTVSSLSFDDDDYNLDSADADVVDDYGLYDDSWRTNKTLCNHQYHQYQQGKTDCCKRASSLSTSSSSSSSDSSSLLMKMIQLKKCTPGSEYLVPIKSS